MPIGKITLSAIDQLEPNSTLWDPHLKGFGVRKNPKRKATFVLKTQVNRRQSWITIGRLGQPWTVETARKEALRLLGEAASGVNIADKHGTSKKGAGFDVVADEYLATHVSKLKARTREVYATIVQKHLKPHFKSYSFNQIERRQIAMDVVECRDPHDLSLLRIGSPGLEACLGGGLTSGARRPEGLHLWYRKALESLAAIALQESGGRNR